MTKKTTVLSLGLLVVIASIASAQATRADSGPVPSIDLEVTINGLDADDPPGPTVEVGETVMWAITVTNTGGLPLKVLELTLDPPQAGPLCIAELLASNEVLEPGDSMACEAEGIAGAGSNLQVTRVVAEVATDAYADAKPGPVNDIDPTHYIAVQAADQGCTPGYWKNHLDSWPATGLDPAQRVESVFAQAAGYDGVGDAELLVALSFGGGPSLADKARILVRAAVAAVLNASHPGVGYSRTVDNVVASVDAALASGDPNAILGLAAALDADNNLGCPLN